MSTSNDRIRRFEHLERARPDGPDGDERPDARERFEGLEARGDATRPPGVPGAAGDRFRAPPERAPDVAAPAGDEQPFVRCMRCEADHSRYARQCTNCGEPLDTEEQRAFNERLWAQRRAERDAADRENEARRESLREAEAEAAAARRQAAELLAREVGERERERLGREGISDGWGRASGRAWRAGVGLLGSLWRLFARP